MLCPSCSHSNDEGIRYCTRCRMSFSPMGLFLSRQKDHLYWVLRRSSAGFTAGLIAWVFVPIVSRVLSMSGVSPFHDFLIGLMGGAFLGCVDGMVEESTPKTIRGAVLGGLGGGLGGFLFFYLKGLWPDKNVLWAIFVHWAIAGAFIGMVSAQWEGKARKLYIGMASGFLGGGIGGYLGASVHVYLVQSYEPQSWLLQRFLEALIGGLIGVSLWFSLGLAERLYIFKRRLVSDKKP